MNLYVGNLPYGVNEDMLTKVFGEVGVVKSARVVTDRETGRSRGFGFVEMGSESEGRAAIERFNGYSLEGRNLVVNEARPREERPRRQGGWGR